MALKIYNKQSENIASSKGKTKQNVRPGNVSFSTWLNSVLHMQYRRAYILPTVIIALVVVMGSVYLYRLEHPQVAPEVNLSSVVPFPQSWLVFQNLTGGPPPTSSNLNIVRPDGVVMHQLKSTYADPLFDEYAGSTGAFSSGLLMSNQLNDGSNITVNKWSVLHADGTSIQVPSILTPVLNNLWDSSGILDGKLFLVGQSLLYGVFENSGGFNFQQINVQTGEVRTIFHINSLGSSVIPNDVQSNAMNAAQTDISFVMNNVSINGRAIAAPSVVVYDVVHGGIKVSALPERLSAITPSSVSMAPLQYALSSDGNLLAYQQSSPSVVGGVRATGLATHIYNTQTGKDYAVNSGMSINLGACPEPFDFSNDGTFLITCGSTSVSNNAVMEIDNATSGSVVKIITSGNSNNYQVLPAGWVAPDVLVYTTNTATTGTSFNAAAETAHSLNLGNGAQHDFAKGLGRLLTVIH